mmetsp:Transcript_66637/g.167944  ORF Transcript_66637/g.167944 Transcript_66637/m.167944 type:complete len:220 (+) Transcript_66637:693-1352(+)
MPTPRPSWTPLSPPTHRRQATLRLGQRPPRPRPLPQPPLSQWARPSWRTLAAQRRSWRSPPRSERPLAGPRQRHHDHGRRPTQPHRGKRAGAAIHPRRCSRSTIPPSMHRALMMRRRAPLSCCGICRTTTPVTCCSNSWTARDSRAATTSSTSRSISHDGLASATPSSIWPAPRRPSASAKCCRALRVGRCRARRSWTFAGATRCRAGRPAWSVTATAR